MTVHTTTRKEEFDVETPTDTITIQDTDVLHMRHADYPFGTYRYTGKFHGLLAEFYSNTENESVLLSPAKLARFIHTDAASITHTPSIEEEFFNGNPPELPDGTADEAILEHRPHESEDEFNTEEPLVENTVDALELPGDSENHSVSESEVTDTVVVETPTEK